MLSKTDRTCGAELEDDETTVEGELELYNLMEYENCGDRELSIVQLMVTLCVCGLYCAVKEVIVNDGSTGCVVAAFGT